MWALGKTGTRYLAPYARTIRVPYAWESKLSGIGDTQYKGVAWYRREFTLPDRWRGQRVWLCFGAVDHHATVWVNGVRVGDHEGGYSEFRFDITPHVRFDRPNTVVVRVEDHTDRETPARQASARLVHQRQRHLADRVAGGDRRGAHRIVPDYAPRGRGRRPDRRCGVPRRA
jgi:beta-galactosidase/beta-glucuronidase